MKRISVLENPWPIAAQVLDELAELPALQLATPAHGTTGLLSTAWRILDMEGVDRLDTPYVDSKAWAASEELAAVAYGTKASYYFPSGVSYAILAGISAVFRNVAEVAVARNVHYSVVSALSFIGAKVRWIPPPGLWFSYGAQHIDGFLDRHPTVGGLVISNPSYEGHLSDVVAISRTCRQRKVRLFVDEALGAQWVVGSPLPESALGHECDGVVHSLHKRMGALVPAGLLHIPSASLVDAAEAQRMVKRSRSTSPSNAVLLSTEWLLQNLTQGTPWPNLAGAVTQISHLKEVLRDLTELTEDPADPLILHIPSGNKDLSEVADYLYVNGINYECLNSRGLTFFFPLTITIDQVRRLESVLVDGWRGAHGSGNAPFEYNSPEMVIELQEAFSSPVEQIPLKEATGRIAGEIQADCPPGIALTVPGERVGGWHLAHLADGPVTVVKGAAND